MNESRVSYKVSFFAALVVLPQLEITEGLPIYVHNLTYISYAIIIKLCCFDFALVYCSYIIYRKPAKFKGSIF